MQSCVDKQGTVDTVARCCSTLDRRVGAGGAGKPAAGGDLRTAGRHQGSRGNAGVAAAAAAAAAAAGTPLVIGAGGCHFGGDTLAGTMLRKAARGRQQCTALMLALPAAVAGRMKRTGWHAGRVALASGSLAHQAAVIAR